MKLAAWLGGGIAVLFVVLTVAMAAAMGGATASLGGCQTTAPAALPAGRFTQQQIGQLWVDEHGPPSQEQIAGAVGMAESQGDPNAEGPTTPSGRAIGLMQILGAVLPGDLRDPRVNMRNAIYKWRHAPHGGRNWSPWTTYTSGAYLRYMGNGAPIAAPAPACDVPLPGASGSVARLISVATWIERQHFTYCYGGGHGLTPARPTHGQWCHGGAGFITQDPSVIGLDCSSSVSMLLQKSGIPVTTMVSTGFESWGDSGPGRQVTIWSNAAHVFVVIRGRTWQTSVSNYHGGPGWTPSRSTAGFVPSHPPGL